MAVAGVRVGGDGLWDHRDDGRGGKLWLSSEQVPERGGIGCPGVSAWPSPMFWLSAVVEEKNHWHASKFSASENKWK